MAPFQFVPGPPLAPTTFFRPLSRFPFQLSAIRSLFTPSFAREGGGPISLIVGPLKGDEKEDDGEREEKQRGRERETRRETSISSRAEIANGVNVAPSSLPPLLSVPSSPYLSIYCILCLRPE